MTTEPKLDGAGFIDKILGMVRRFISGAMRSSIEELLSQPLREMRDNLGSIGEDIGDLGAGQARLEIRLDDTNKQIMVLGARLDARIDGLDKKIDGLGERLDKKIDETTGQLGHRIDGLGNRIDALDAQQRRTFEEVAALKRDQKSADVVERRLARIEDRVFARTG